MLDPDYKTAQLLAKARTLATIGPDAGSDLARCMLEVCAKLEEAVEANLRLDAWVHDQIKAIEEATG